jgi:hypothetical protein
VPASKARAIIAVASEGLVANSVPGGIPAAAQRAGSVVHDRGRYSARSMNAYAPGGIGQVDRDLRVLDPARGAGVLALHPDRASALLQVAGLVDLCRPRHRSIYADSGTMPTWLVG